MTHQHGYIGRKDDYLKRLRRIEGQTRDLQRMVDEEKYCIDILTQVAAMTGDGPGVGVGGWGRRPGRGGRPGRGSGCNTSLTGLDGR